MGAIFKYGDILRKKGRMIRPGPVVQRVQFIRYEGHTLPVSSRVGTIETFDAGGWVLDE